MEHETIRILLIDDDRADFLITEAMLNQIDQPRIALDWVSTFEEGKAALEADAYDLYLLDYMLDEQTGLDMLRQVGRDELRSPVIMLTGKGSVSVDVEAMHLGVADYLTKGNVDPELAERTIRFALDRQASQRELQRSEERHRGMFDNLPFGLFRCTPEGGFIDANPALVRLLGYPDLETLKGVYAAGFYVDPKDRSHFLAALGRLGIVSGFETQLEGRDGRKLKLRTTARVHRDAGGQVAYVEGAVEDMTDAWPTVGFYLDAARFQRMFRAGPVGLIIIGIDGLIQDANPIFLTVSGYEVGELIQTSFVDLWAEEDQASTRQDVTAMCAGRAERSEGARRFRSHQGKTVSAYVTMALIRDWDDAPDHILVMVEHVAEKKAVNG